MAGDAAQRLFDSSQVNSVRIEEWAQHESCDVFGRQIAVW